MPASGCTSESSAASAGTHPAAPGWDRSRVRARARVRVRVRTGARARVKA